MSERIETGQQARDFISQGDAQLDPEWFWEQLDCSWGAIQELAMSTMKAIPPENRHDPGYAILCMEMGARLALRIDAVKIGEASR
jgi:hypothetical protein